MTVREYYTEHFSEMSPEKRFHFATRMKNFLGTQEFDAYLSENMPSMELAPIFADNDYSRVKNAKERAAYFEKYPGLYGIEAALFRVNHLLNEYGRDVRPEFLENCSREKLYKLCDDLMADEGALITLSTWAVNVICLTEYLFPRGRNVVGELAEWVLRQDKSKFEAGLYVYFCTHIIICESQFYTRQVPQENLEILRKLLEASRDVIRDQIDTITLDAGVEFLVCCKMAGVRYPEIVKIIGDICDEYRKDSPYLINYRRDARPGSYFHTLDGAEHINVLYIMSGLDH